VPVIQKERTKPCEVSLEIEVEPELVSKAVDEAYREAGKTAEVPGFRKGKAPRAVLERYVPEERVLARAVDKLVQPAYERALEETGIKPFGDAEYEVVHLRDAEPFVFRAKVPLEPTVKLGNYVGIEVERLARQVSDEDVEHEIDVLRERSAQVENVRPVQKGDLVIVRLTEPDGETRETIIEAGKNLESFDAGLIGMNAGETKTIELVYPKDYEDAELAGTTGRVTVTVSDIKERRVPELTDEFVRQMTEEFDEKIETVEELRRRIRSIMERSAAELADREVKSKIVEKVVENSEICFPDSMLDREVARRLQNLLGELESRKLTLEDYLKATERTFEELRSQIERSAERDLRINLALFEVIKQEKIEVSDEEVEAEVARIAQKSGRPVESLNAYLDKTGGRQDIRSRLLRRKVLDFLVHASNIKHVGRAKS